MEYFKDNLDELKKVFETLRDDMSGDTIATANLIQNIQLESQLLYDCFDPTDRGRITLQDFLTGIQQLKHKADTTFQSLDEAIDSFDSSLTDSTTEDLPSEHLEVASPTLQLDFTQNQQKSINLLDIDDNMSMLENNKVNNFNFSQTEECFEFTPTKDDETQRKDNSGDSDELNLSNGEDSYHSLKSTFNQRNTWLRSSVRRSGSNLHRNSSLGPYTSSPYKKSNSPSNGTNGTNSLSRRNSLSYESDEMNNDPNSLEEDVHNLNEKINKLQNQIEFLLDGQNEHELKYTNVKKENSNLLSKIHLLEEQIRDIEVHSEVKRKEDERRLTESMAKLDREKAQELQNYVSQILSLQEELFKAKEELRRQQETVDRLHRSNEEMQEKLQDKEREIGVLNSEISQLNEINRKQEIDCVSKTKLICELNQQLVSARQAQDWEHDEVNNQRRQANTQNIRNYSEYEEQLKMLKEENRSLKDMNEELKEEMLNNHLMEGKSLIKEGEAISSLANEINDLNVEQLKTTLKEQQDVNAKLRSYIDGILLNIVENYPQLLEVKSGSPN